MSIVALTWPAIQAPTAARASAPHRARRAASPGTGRGDRSAPHRDDDPAAWIRTGPCLAAACATSPDPLYGPARARTVRISADRWWTGLRRVPGPAWRLVEPREN